MFDWSGLRNKHNGLVPFVSQWIKQKKLLKKSQSTRQLAYTRVTVSSKRRIKLIKHRRSSLIKQWNNALLWQTTYTIRNFPTSKTWKLKTCFSLPHYIYLEIKQIYIKSFFFFKEKNALSLYNCKFPQFLFQV